MHKHVLNGHDHGHGELYIKLAVAFCNLSDNRQAANGVETIITFSGFKKMSPPTTHSNHQQL